jgi:hypothetical protein
MVVHHLDPRQAAKRCGLKWAELEQHLGEKGYQKYLNDLKEIISVHNINILVAKASLVNSGIKYGKEFVENADPSSSEHSKEVRQWTFNTADHSELAEVAKVDKREITHKVKDERPEFVRELSDLAARLGYKPPALAHSQNSEYIVTPNSPIDIEAEAVEV